MALININDNAILKRNSNSEAIVNVDLSAFQKARARKNINIKTEQRLKTIEDNINNINETLKTILNKFQ